MHQVTTSLVFLNHMKPPSLVLPVFWYIYLHLFLVTTLNSLSFVPNTSAHALANDTDDLALIKFKGSISNDPNGILNSWNSSNHYCKWYGITCRTKDQRVIELNLTGYQLHGSISPHLGNLSFLRHIDLENNSFYGNIPQELGRLSRLRLLYLNNNSLAGEIPVNLTRCSNLRGFDFSWNNLIGKIPIEIGSLWKLNELFVERNDLIGQIPPSIGNLSSLSALVLSSNNLEGNIPQELGSLKNLTHLLIDVNKLSGALPSCLYNMSSLIVISAVVNQFTGSLPPDMFHNLPNLQWLQIGRSHIAGAIPTSITNASSLQLLDFAGNHFVGQVPSLGKLTKLRFLSLSGNNLGGNSTKDLEFLKPLTNCSNLEVLFIDHNNFGGQLPSYSGNLSNNLTHLYLGYNQIYGKIPPELGSLVNMIALIMPYSHFDGIIPSTFGNFQKMEVLDLRGNKLSGDMPIFLGNLTQLFYLALQENMLEGSIPPAIGNCQKLQHLNLSNNNLGGTIPSEVFSLPSLTLLLDLSQNSFSGNLPDEVSNLKNLNMLIVSENNLSGHIPESIGECLSLEFLYLQGNLFDGVIPSSLASLRGLRILDLSRNRLSGLIPEGLENISLEYLNISLNMLEGEVPTNGVFGNASEFALTGNIKLCGGISELHLQPCLSIAKKPTKHHNFKLIAVVVCIVGFLLLLSLFLTPYWWRKRTKKRSSDSLTIDQLAKVSYQNLHDGTDGFSTRNLIGFGGFGSVYKGTLEIEERVVAIKVLNLQKKGAHKSFVAECNALKNIRHRNLVKILTCCSSSDYKGEDFKALVFEFMANGSLESWLHPSTEIADPRSLDLEQRFNIINDVASACHYLHYECGKTIIHCDLKPSNVLLDDSMVAHVSDFGLARLLTSIGESPLQSSSIGIKGTFGYAPPEYGMGFEVSMEGDMYSFGILLLEMLIGRRPTDEMCRDGHNLHNYAKISIPSQLWQIVDPSILPKELQEATENENHLGFVHSDVEKCLLSLFRIALDCSLESPKERMTMVDVKRELNRIKSYFPSTMLTEANNITNAKDT